MDKVDRLLQNSKKEKSVIPTISTPLGTKTVKEKVYFDLLLILVILDDIQHIWIIGIVNLKVNMMRMTKIPLLDGKN